MDHQIILIGLLLSLLAGLSTGIGSLCSLFCNHTNVKFLSTALGFSAGVMIYVSFVELFAGSFEMVAEDFGARKGSWITVVAFFAGMLLVTLIDKLIPSFENPHEIHKIEEMKDAKLAKKSRKLFKMGVMTALIIAIHNFPEGLVTFTSTVKDIKLGIPIAIAVAIHNFPEGISVSIPIYFATKSRKKAIYYSFASGMAEPLGALIGYFLLRSFFTNGTIGLIFSFVAGIMVFISLDQLLPTAQKYGEHHLSIYGMVAGMAMMAVSLLLFM